MKIDTEKMCNNEIRKIGLIIEKLNKIGWDVSGHGEAGVNPNSGNVYIWLDDYPVVPYISLGDDEVCFSFSCLNCGEEWDISEDDVKAEKYPKKCEECGERF